MQVLVVPLYWNKRGIAASFGSGDSSPSLPLSPPPEGGDLLGPQGTPPLGITGWYFGVGEARGGVSTGVVSAGKNFKIRMPYQRHIRQFYSSSKKVKADKIA